MVAATHLPTRHAARASSRVTVHGKLGTIRYSTHDGMCGVQLDGEERVDEYTDEVCVPAVDADNEAKLARIFARCEACL